jgi:hypothetical protein
MAKVRLLVCHHCESVQEIPWCGEDPQCRHPACNDALNYRVAQHQFGDGRPHAPANLADIDEDIWKQKSKRPDILVNLARIVDPGAGAGLGESLYDVKSNFEQDAMKCWKAHNRTHDCGDYKSPQKLLVPDTKAERKELGLTPVRPTSYLCDYCPVKSIVQQRVYSEEYGYNYDG